MNQAQTYTAMCLWEHVIADIRDRPDVEAAFEAVGTHTIRVWVMNMAEACDEAYGEAVRYDYDEPFDWEFVPEWFEANMNWNDIT